MKSFATWLLLLILSCTRVVAIGLRRTQASRYHVDLVLALFYVDEDLAAEFESELKRGPPFESLAVSHFCDSVRDQVTGQKVREITEPFGVAIESPADSANGCIIERLERNFDNDAEDFLGAGHFILQVHVNQAVYVTSPQRNLQDNEVSSFAKYAFSRTSGGRSLFRALLRENSSFESILSVELVNDESIPSWVQFPPTTEPTTLPTQEPTREPTLDPTTDHPTMHPSSAPTLPPTHLPTHYPTESPSLLPSISPSLIPTKVISSGPSMVNLVSSEPSTFPSGSGWFPNPSLPGLATGPTRSPMLVSTAPVPTGTPDAKFVDVASSYPTVRSTDDITTGGAAIVAEEESHSKVRLIVGAIVGGLSLVVVSLFFVYCVIPFCIESKEEVEHPAAVPGHVSVDDTQSLANTSLGDHTAGGAFRILPKASRGSTVSGGTSSLNVLDSFDDNSLFTSITDSSKPQQNAKPTELYNGPVDIDALADDEEDDDDDIFTGLSDIYPYFDKKTARGPGNKVKKAGKQSKLQSVGKGTVVDTSLVDSEDVSQLSGTSDAFSSLSQIQPSGAASSKDNDPQGGHGNSTMGEIEGDDGESTTFSVGTSFISAGGQGMSTFSLGASFLSNGASEEKRAARANDNVEVIPTVSEGVHSNQRNRVKASEHSRSLPSTGFELQTGLEQADVTGQGRQTEENSVKMKNAPKRAVTQKREQNAGENNEMLRIVLENSRRLFEEEQTSGASLKSVPSPTKKKQIDRARSLSPRRARARFDDLGNSTKSVRKKQTSIFEKHPAFASKRHSEMTATPEKGNRSDHAGSGMLTPPSSSEKSPYGTLGADPRDNWLKHEEKKSDTPESSPGVLGIQATASGQTARSKSHGTMATPWLFDDVRQMLGFSPTLVEHGERDPIARERSSHDGDLGQFLSRKPPPHPSSVNGSHASAASLDIIPRSLDMDLKRLDGLSEVLGVHKECTSLTSASTKSSPRSRRTKVVVTVPPGKLGVVLSNMRDGHGTIVSDVRPNSSMHGFLTKGDKLVALDGEDIADLNVGQVTSLMSSRVDYERRLTVLSRVTTKV